MLYGISEYISLDEYERTVEEVAEEIVDTYPEADENEVCEAMAHTYEQSSEMIQFLYSLGINNAYVQLASDLHRRVLAIKKLVIA